jgi:hypothetical protein
VSEPFLTAFIAPALKPLKRLSARSSRLHRAEATVLMDIPDLPESDLRPSRRKSRF